MTPHVLNPGAVGDPAQTPVVHLGAGAAEVLGLFDAAPFVVEADTAEPAEKLSADRRRTVRQAEAIALGGHPLALVFPSVRMHPDADRTAQPTDAKDLPLRCGSCRFRQALSAGNRSVPKCLWRSENPTDQQPHHGGPDRLSHSVATDIRAWWPACDRYTAGEPALSDDAARWIPPNPLARCAHCGGPTDGALADCERAECVAADIAIGARRDRAEDV